MCASKIAGALAKHESIENLKILLLRAEVANRDLPKQLEEMGAIVDDVAVYKTVPETDDRNGAAARLMEQGADWITFTSSSTVENFNARFDLKQLAARYPQLKLASIGPETSKAIAALGLEANRGSEATHHRRIGQGHRVKVARPDIPAERRTRPVAPGAKDRSSGTFLTAIDEGERVPGFRFDRSGRAGRCSSADAGMAAARRAIALKAPC